MIPQYNGVLEGEREENEWLLDLKHCFFPFIVRKARVNEKKIPLVLD